jgi:hypothetical protein
MISGTTTLATALELARMHGIRFAAIYLCEEGIAFEVAVEVLTQKGANQDLQIDEVVVAYGAASLLPMPC